MISEWQTKWQVSDAAMVDLRLLFTSLPRGDEKPATGPEGDVQNLIRVKAPEIGCVMLRNNSGAFLRESKDANEDEIKRMIRFGLGNDSKKLNAVYKSPDLVGVRWDGRAIFCEVKAPGWRFSPNDEHEKAQLAFLTHMASFGALCGFAQSVDDFLFIVNRG